MSLSREELQGVIAHEFSHILYGDMLINARLQGILHGILVIGLLGEIMVKSAFSTDRVGLRSAGKGQGGGGFYAILIGVALLILGYTGVFIARLIKSAVARQREFLADAAAVQFTRNPLGLAGALKKIGGLTAGSLILLGGEPGIGKSTLVAQIAACLTGRQATVQAEGEVIYVSGEESAGQIKARFNRLGIKPEKIKFLSETNAEKIIATINQLKPGLVIIDSIQTIYSAAVAGEPGGINQIRGSTVGFLEAAKKNNTAIILIGHITKDGALAGPKTLEHIVDTVLYLETETNHDYRILRATKNRFGSINEIGIFTWKSQNVQYAHHCHTSHDLFGCASLRNAEYCILNKQYSKEEFEKLRAQIIQDMNNNPYTDSRGVKYKFGEFYPTELSYFGYNETIAQEQFPMTREEVFKNNWKWQDSFQLTKGKETIKSESIPEVIDDVKDQITKEILQCIDCERNYKITEAELTLYRRMQVPIPHRCFYCRLSTRLKKRNSYKLWHRKCMKPECTNEFETSYAPDRPEIVYCETCYNNEVA